MLVNCDIGERGANHPIDNQLMQNIQMANIACGGHAGDSESIKWYMGMARKYGVAVSAHLSYPDKENFGRVSMQIGIEELAKTLDIQMNLLNSHRIIKVNAVKFHGALYNDSVKDSALASVLVCWLKEKGIRNVITDATGCLAKECEQAGIDVIAEFFAERNYVVDDEGNARLAPRTLPFASIHDLDAAVAHTLAFNSTEHTIEAYKEEDGVYKPVAHKFDVSEDSINTVCIHSDSPIALDLAKMLKEVI